MMKDRGFSKSLPQFSKSKLSIKSQEVAIISGFEESLGASHRSFSFKYQDKQHLDFTKTLDEALRKSSKF